MTPHDASPAGERSPSGRQSRTARSSGSTHDDDLSATLARLQELGDELAAVVVDPLVLAEVQATSEDDGHGDRDVAAALLELLRVWTSDDPHLPQRSVVVVADERRSVGVGPVGGCARFGLTAPLSVVGEGWFGGYGGGALLGRDDLLAALDPADPDAGTGDGRGAVPHPVVAAAGLATLDLLDQPAPGPHSRSGRRGCGWSSA